VADSIGQPGDALAGKKAELEKSMLEVCATPFGLNATDV
jgi:hypothetical protein